MKYNSVLNLANDYEQACNNSLLKVAFVRKLPNGKYRVLSEKGKNLGTYTSRDAAKKRLKQIEFFKHIDKNNLLDSSSVIDLTDVEELTYSALMRKLRRKAPPECVREFMKIFKKYFDNAVKNKLQKPDSVAMQNALLLFNKKHKIKLSKDIVKNAAISELGDSRLVGKYLSDIVKFIMTRISSEKRAKSLYGLKLKIYNLNEN